MKKIISTITILVILINNPVLIMAQEASSSATPILENATAAPTPSPTPTSMQTDPNSLLKDAESTQQSIRTEDKLDTLSGKIIFDNQKIGTINSSARFRTLPRIKKLSKKNYKIDEKITVTIENTVSENTKITLFNDLNQEVPVQTEIIHNLDPTIIKLLPPRNFKPGRYRLKITDSEGNESTQDFTWGVLAINTNKSIYSPQETAKLAIAVLDERGMMVCDARLELAIYNPDGIKTILTTDNGEIKVNPECFLHDFTTKPDYETEYQTGTPGKYSLTLTAQTKNGSFTIDDAFEVRTDIPYDIERESATRIYPPKTYPVKITINANQDFKGEIKEIVPSNFIISTLDGTTPYKDLKVIEGKEVKSASPEAGFSLVPPFSGEHTMTNDFGEEVEDPLLKTLYQNSGLKGHDGLDYAIPEGTPIYSVDEGLVYFTGDEPYGNTIMIQHSWGKSYYGHLSEILVEQGQTVLPGDRIGLSGSTGLSTGPHLHFGIKLNRNESENGYFGKINPLPYLNYSSFVTDSDTVQIITWEVDLKAGDELEIGYQFKAPNESPQLYLLGPLQLRDVNNELTHQEFRQWQIAADADVTIDSGLAGTANAHKEKPRIVFTSDQVGYAFYSKSGQTSFRYRKTTDGGASWPTETTVETNGSICCAAIAVWYDQWTPGDSSGTYIHIVYQHQVDELLYYNRLDTSDDSLLTADSTNVGSTAFDVNDAVSITKATDDYIYIGSSDSDGGSAVYYCNPNAGSPAHCASGGQTWTAATGHGLDTTTAHAIRLLPLASDDIMLIRNDFDGADEDFESNIWNGSTWAGWVEFDSNAPDNTTYRTAWGATVSKSDNKIYVAYVADVGVNDTGELRTAVYDSSWTSKTDAVCATSPDGNCSDALGASESLIGADIGMDENNESLYVTYIRGTAGGTGDVFYKTSTDGMTNWSSQSSAINTTYTSNHRFTYLNMMSNERIYSGYMNQGANDIMGVNIADLTPDTGPTNDQLLKHGGWVSGGVDNPFTF